MLTRLFCTSFICVCECIHMCVFTCVRARVCARGVKMSVVWCFTFFLLYFTLFWSEAPVTIRESIYVDTSYHWYIVSVISGFIFGLVSIYMIDIFLFVRYGLSINLCIFFLLSVVFVVVVFLIFILIILNDYVGSFFSLIYLCRKEKPKKNLKVQKITKRKIEYI